MKELKEEDKEKLHQFYLALRSLYLTSIVPSCPVQRSFEEAINGFIGENTWLPTHISKNALKEIAEGRHRNVQRAHGILPDRLDRFERTIKILSGEEKTFDEWWDFYTTHDKTVLITKEEHSSKINFKESDLILIPEEPKMFRRGGFSFKIREKIEITWAKKILESSFS